MQHILLYFFGLLFLTTSCNVSNNLYINDPVPVGKGEVEVCVALGTGLEADIDSISSVGDIYFNNEYNYSPIFYVGGQLGLGEKLNLRFALHFPYVIGGFGLRSGIQYSFFSATSKFNLAMGTDLGFVFAKDTVTVFGADIPAEITTEGAINADFFLPIGYSFSDQIRITITPRYSFNGVFVRKNENESKTKLYKPQVFGLSLGMRFKSVYFEYTSLYYKNQVIPSFGIGYLVSSKSKSNEPQYYID
jgi:hypothetical protein